MDCCSNCLHLLPDEGCRVGYPKDIRDLLDGCLFWRLKLVFVPNGALMQNASADVLRAAFASIGYDVDSLFFPFKTAVHTKQFCCSGCGKMFWAAEAYAQLRAMARLQPFCSGTKCTGEPNA